MGGRRASPWGLYDIYGNVWQWCQDWYAGDYYAKSPADDPAGPPAGLNRVSRGGGWSGPAGVCRSAFRRMSVVSWRDGGLGFRVSLAGRNAANAPAATIRLAPIADITAYTGEDDVVPVGIARRLRRPHIDPC